MTGSRYKSLTAFRRDWFQGQNKMRFAIIAALLFYTALTVNTWLPLLTRIF